jgi:hypothetical protein
LLRRRGRSASRQADVELRDFGASDGAVVRDLCGHGSDYVVQADDATRARGGAACSLIGVGCCQAGVVERCVCFEPVSMSCFIVEPCQLTKPEAKLVTRSNARFVKVSVVDVESLGIVVVTADDRSTVIGCLLCDGVREFAARRCGTVQDIDETVARFLTRYAKHCQ